MSVTNGARLKCEQCGAEAIVLRSGEDPELACCGEPVVFTFAPDAAPDA